MSYALGEEDFIDGNGNAYFDAVDCHLAADPGNVELSVSGKLA